MGEGNQARGKFLRALKGGGLLGVNAGCGGEGADEQVVSRNNHRHISCALRLYLDFVPIDIDM